MQRFVLVGLFMLVLVLVGPVGAEAADDDVKVVTIPVNPAKAGRRKAPVPGGPNDKSALWWNDPGIVKSLSLTEEQRKKMGAYQKAYIQKAPQGGRPEVFQETLVQGDWKQARIESEKIASAAEESVRMRGALKIDILALLSDEQRQKLVDHYPRLIYKPWRRAMRESAESAGP